MGIWQRKRNRKTSKIPKKELHADFIFAIHGVFVVPLLLFFGRVSPPEAVDYSNRFRM
jgi:hypothetical protein